MAVDADVETRTAKQIARDWFEERLDEDTTSVTDLAREAATELSEDEDFASTFLQDFAYSVLYQVGQQMLANRRTALRTREGLLAQIQKDIEDAEKQKTAFWSTWREYDPDRKVYVSLVKMTREQLLSASAYRQQLADANRHESQWLKIMADRMKPGECWEDHHTDAELTVLRESMKVSAS